MVRRSLLDPIPELELAARLLDASVDALALGRTDMALDLVAQADMPEIITQMRRLVSTITPEVHGNIKRPKCLPKAARDQTRMPSIALQHEIFHRDGWRCRFCGIKVISKAARSVLAHRLGIPVNWTSNKLQSNSALYALASSLDHVIPHGRGGKNEPGNFVTACYGCQFGRGEWTLEEVSVQDPRTRSPVKDSWDGLTRILALQPNNSFKPKPLRGWA